MRVKPSEVLSWGEGRLTLLWGNVGESLGKIVPDLRLFHLGVVYRDACALGKEITNERDGGGFAGVACVGLECKAENGNVLPRANQLPRLL